MPMKKIYTLFVLLSLLMICVPSLDAQVDTAFWFAVPHITHSHAGRPIKLCVSTLGSPATVTVTQPARNNTTVTTFTVPANSSQTYQLISSSESSLTNFECNHNQTSNYGIYIRSTAQINAYISVQNNNSEIYALKGRNAYGKHFFIAMQGQFPNANAYSDARNSVEIIATQDNTTVTITPSVTLYGGGHPANVPFTVTLNRGQVYSFASNSQAADSHLDRTTITSDKPIVVDVSDDSATPNGSNQDLVADQIVPEELAGEEYMAVPSPSAANNTYSGGLSDYVFMYPLENGTDITVYSSNNADGFPSTSTNFNNLNRGDKRSYHFTNHYPIYIVSTKPIFVFQVTGAGNELGGTLLPHMYCTGSTIASYKPEPSVNGHTKHIYLTLLCSSLYTDGFQINGQSNLLTAADWHTIPEHTFKYCCKEITSLNTANSIRVTNSLGKFHLGIIDYHQQGSGYDDCSISYFSDYSSSSSLSWLTDSMNLSLCQGEDLNFAFDTVNAEILRIEGPNNFLDNEAPYFLTDVQPDNAGWYTVYGRDNRHCLVELLTDSVWIDVHPSSLREVMDTVCFGSPYQGYGFTVPATNTQQTGIVNDTIHLQTNEYGCDSLVVLSLMVRDSVREQFDISACEQYVWNNVPYAASGDYTQLFTDRFGCDSIVTMHLDISEGNVQIEQSSDDVCDGGFTLLTANSNYSNYLWNTGEQSPSIEVTQSGTYSVTVTEGDCEVSGSYIVDPCPFNLFLPNAISPSSEDGLNDYFHLNNTQDITSCSIYIYNREGNLVFHSEDKYFKWNGEEAGKVRINKTYNYILFYTLPNGGTSVAKGSITVL